MELNMWLRCFFRSCRRPDNCLIFNSFIQHSRCQKRRWCWYGISGLAIFDCVIHTEFCFGSTRRVCGSPMRGKGWGWWFDGRSLWCNGRSWWCDRRCWRYHGISWWCDGQSWWCAGRSWWCDGRFCINTINFFLDEKISMFWLVSKNVVHLMVDCPHKQLFISK